MYCQFQSTHPLRGATCPLYPAKGESGISIHAPLAGCDALDGWETVQIIISIHAPLAGCDIDLFFVYAVYKISIHAPLAGCDYQPWDKIHHR